MIKMQDKEIQLLKERIERLENENKKLVNDNWHLRRKIDWQSYDYDGINRHRYFIKHREKILNENLEAYNYKDKSLLKRINKIAPEMENIFVYLFEVLASIKKPDCVLDSKDYNINLNFIKAFYEIISLHKKEVRHNSQKFRNKKEKLTKRR